MSTNEASTDPSPPRFNLLREPWIAVLDGDGNAAEVSILDAFTQAREIREIVGEVPTQSFAILRLLLAVLHRAVSGPTDSDHWEQIRRFWDSDVLRLIEDYSSTWDDRFWLQHPRTPFYQVHDLHNQRDETAPPGLIVSDGPGTSSFLSTRLGRHLERISWSEGARWLVHTHAFDYAGVHTGAVGDPRVSGGKGFPIGPGWAGQLGGTYLVGANLQETLLLNLVAPESVGLLGGADDLPVWERPQHTQIPEGWPDGAYSTKNLPYREPQGIVDVLTWQSRRVRLVGDDDGVTGVVNAQGDRLFPQNRQDVEAMTGWRYSEPQSKKFGRPTYMPQELDPTRSLWRGLASLLPHVEVRSASTEPARRLPPSVMSWAAKLKNAEILQDRIVTVRAIGVEYINNQTALGGVVDDVLTLPVTLLADPDAALTQLSIEAVDCADKAVYAYGSLATNVVLAAGGSTESDGPRDRAAERAFSALDSHFRGWVITLDATSDPVERRAAWQVTVADVLRGLAATMLQEAGPAATVGRMAGGRFVDAGLAERYFVKKLRDVLPAAHPSRDGDGTETDPSEDDTQEVA